MMRLCTAIVLSLLFITPPANATHGTEDVCARTTEVHDEIVKLITGITVCADITATHLAGITTLNLADALISNLKDGDFAGLSALSTLSLQSNPITTFPDNLFAGLSTLTSLNLGDTGSTFTIPARLFVDLPDNATIDFGGDPVIVALDADAGMDQSVVAGEQVTLTGKAISYLPTAQTYAWTQIGTPTVTLSDASAAMPTFTAPLVTTDTDLVFSLRVTASVGTPTLPKNATDRVTLTVTNPAPTAKMTIMPVTLTVGVAYVLDDVSNYFSDGDDTLTYTVSSGDTTTTTVAQSGNRLTVTPVAVGTTTITLTATDTAGGTANQTFVVTVNPPPPPNPAPTPKMTIMPATLTVGVAYVLDDVSNYFSDGDDTLTYTVSSGDTTIATVAQSGNRLTVTPVAVGTTTITLTATDTAGGTANQTFMVTVTPRVGPTAREITTLNQAITPRLTQAVVASTLIAVGNRIDAVFSAPQTANYSLEGNTWRQKLPTYVQSLAKDSSNWKQMLSHSSFVLPLNVAESSSGGDSAGDAGITVWGSGDYREMSSNTDVDWKGTLFSVQLGLDKRIRHNLLVGGLLSRSTGDIDYSLNATSAGKYIHKMTSFHPYLAWSDGGISLWGSAGYGKGKLEIKENSLKNSADTNLLSLALGVKGALPQVAGLSIKSDIALVQIRIDDSADGDFEISKQTINSQRLRLLLESARQRTLVSGGTFTPIMELGVRYDGGDGEGGVGAILGTGARYANTTGLSMEGKVHALVGHNDYKEWGVSGVIRQQIGKYGRGLSFSLSPSYGKTDGNADQVWEGNPEGNSPDYNARLNVNIGYGLLAPDGGLLTPYSEITVAEQARNYRLGLRWKPDSPFNLHLVGEREQGNTVKHRVLLESTIRF